LTGAAAGSERVFGWRTTLRREIALLLALKLLALTALWWLFFSPIHRTSVDAVSAGRRLGVEAAAVVGESMSHGSVQPGEQP